MDLVPQIEFQIELLSNFETNLGLFIKGRAFQGCRMEGVYLCYIKTRQFYAPIRKLQSSLSTIYIGSSSVDVEAERCQLMRRTSLRHCT